MNYVHDEVFVYVYNDFVIYVSENNNGIRTQVCTPVKLSCRDGDVFGFFCIQLSVYHQRDPVSITG